ncbi:MAG: hypothetical protein ACFFE8_07665 [Candidatus Heimdallarchaeota archaeon]
MVSDLQELLQNRLLNSLKLTSDLFESIGNSELTLKIKDSPSNTIGEQAWCIIGARESYLTAVENERWVGFSCSLRNTYDIEEIRSKLNSSYENVGRIIQRTTLSILQNEFLFQLLEHEVQHHGQLIRYFYTNRLKFPRTWNKRYTV